MANRLLTTTRARTVNESALTIDRANTLVEGTTNRSIRAFDDGTNKSAVVTTVVHTADRESITSTFTFSDRVEVNQSRGGSHARTKSGTDTIQDTISNNRTSGSGRFATLSQIFTSLGIRTSIEIPFTRSSVTISFSLASIWASSDDNIRLIATALIDGWIALFLTSFLGSEERSSSGSGTSRNTDTLTIHNTPTNHGGFDTGRARITIQANRSACGFLGAVLPSPFASEVTSTDTLNRTLLGHAIPADSDGISTGEDGRALRRLARARFLAFGVNASLIDTASGDTSKTLAVEHALGAITSSVTGGAIETSAENCGVRDTVSGALGVDHAQFLAGAVLGGTRVGVDGGASGGDAGLGIRAECGKDAGGTGGASNTRSVTNTVKASVHTIIIDERTAHLICGAVVHVGALARVTARRKLALGGDTGDGGTVRADASIFLASASGTSCSLNAITEAATRIGILTRIGANGEVQSTSQLGVRIHDHTRVRADTMAPVAFAGVVSRSGIGGSNRETLTNFKSRSTRLAVARVRGATH